MSHCHRAGHHSWWSLLLCSGAILFALGVIAEYLGVAVSMAMGKPLYLIVSDPNDGPLGRGADGHASIDDPVPHTTDPSRKQSANSRSSSAS